MARFHNINGEHVAFTSEEEAARDAEEKAWEDGETDRNWEALRSERNAKLAASDWMANSDVTMSDAWKSYRQSLRDLTSNTADPSDVTWPTAP